MSHQGQDQLFRAMLASLIHNGVAAPLMQAGSAAPLMQAGSAAPLMQAEHQPESNSVRIEELHSVSVECQTEVSMTDASTQTNPFVDYERPLSFDVATHWEEDMSTSDSGQSSFNSASILHSTAARTPLRPLGSSVVEPPRQSPWFRGRSYASARDSEDERPASFSQWRASEPHPVENFNRLDRRPHSSLPRAVNRPGPSPDTHQLPWEQDNEDGDSAASTSLHSASDSAYTPGRPTATATRRRRVECSTTPSEPPKKRGRPRKRTGVTCRQCEEPTATMHVTPCNHYFCKPCIDNWLNSWSHCPKC